MSELELKVRTLIRKANQSAAEICRATSVSPSSMSQFISGDKGLSVDAMERIIRHLGYEIELRRLKEKR